MANSYKDRETRKMKVKPGTHKVAWNHTPVNHHGERWLASKPTLEYFWIIVTLKWKITSSTETNSIQLALFKSPLILPPSACQKGPLISSSYLSSSSASTVIRKNVPDVRPQLTLYSCLLIQRKCQPSQQMLSISSEVMEPLGSNARHNASPFSCLLFYMG